MNTRDQPEDAQGRQVRRLKPVTAKSLENAAKYYLERFAASTDKLRAVLTRKVERTRRRGGTVLENAAQAIEAIVGRYVQAGLLDDRRYAEMKAQSLRRRGDSARRVRLKLKMAGIDDDGAAAALAQAADETGDDSKASELRAALRLAERRRLGPYRAKAMRKDMRQRDIAAMARAGFSSDVARRVIDAVEPQSLLEDD